jgi:outer membrane protein assembly factor BamD (BamD/ComL family)
MKGILLALAAFTLLAACASGPVEVPEDTPPAKIIQRAQEASDVNKYKLALQYYEVLRERFAGSAEYRCTAEYEIAFIQYKQKKYAEARKGFETLLEKYGEVDAELLPPQFKILSERVLAHISELGF